LAVAASLKLNPEGLGLFVVTPSFFSEGSILESPSLLQMTE
jgi:hypothetical protein